MKLQIEITNDKLLYSWETSQSSTETCTMDLTAEGLCMFANMLEHCCRHRNFMSEQRRTKITEPI